jgi:hypothetical protein
MSDPRKPEKTDRRPSETKAESDDRELSVEELEDAAGGRTNPNTMCDPQPPE